jgi:hypothetical protein
MTSRRIPKVPGDAVEWADDLSRIQRLCREVDQLPRSNNWRLIIGALGRQAFGYRTGHGDFAGHVAAFWEIPERSLSPHGLAAARMKRRLGTRVKGVPWKKSPPIEHFVAINKKHRSSPGNDS